MQTSDAGVIEACLGGLRLTRERPLTDDERRRIQLEASRLSWRAIGTFAGTPLILAIGAIVAQELQCAAELAICTAILLYILSIPLQILAGAAPYDRLRLLRRDLSAGVVKVFISPSSKWKPKLPRDLQSVVDRTPAYYEDRPFSIELLSVSGRVWKVCDIPSYGWITIEQSKVTAPPPIAAIAANWLQPWTSTETHDVSRGQRELNAAEIAELTAFSRHIASRGVVPVVLCTLFAAIFSFAVFSEFPGDVVELTLAAIIFCAAAGACYKKSQDLRWARLLAKDARIGKVWIVSWTRRATADATRGKGRIANRLAEQLQATKWYWTVEGESPRWRRQISAKVNSATLRIS